MESKTVKGKRSRAIERKARTTARKVALAPPAMTVTFRHVDSSDALRAYAERKFAHIGKLLKRPSEAHLILTVDKYRQHGEVTLKSGRLAVTAAEETKDLYAVIDLLADKVGRQLKSHLGKSKTRKVRAPSASEVLAAAETTRSSGGERA